MILRRGVVLVRFVRGSLSRIARQPQCALSTGGQGACCVLCLSLGPGAVPRCAQVCPGAVPRNRQPPGRQVAWGSGATVLSRPQCLNLNTRRMFILFCYSIVKCAFSWSLCVSFIWSWSQNWKPSVRERVELSRAWPQSGGWLPLSQSAPV